MIASQRKTRKKTKIIYIYIALVLFFSVVLTGLDKIICCLLWQQKLHNSTGLIKGIQVDLVQTSGIKTEKPAPQLRQAQGCKKDTRREWSRGELLVWTNPEKVELLTCSLSLPLCMCVSLCVCMWKQGCPTLPALDVLLLLPSEAICRQVAINTTFTHTTTKCKLL